MNPTYALLQRELKDLEAIIEKTINGLSEQHAQDNDDSVVDGIVAALEQYLQVFGHYQEGLPSRTEKDMDAYDELNLSVRKLISGTKDRLIEIGCEESLFDDWFTAYLAPPSDD
jgi:hypothetical protein